MYFIKWQKCKDINEDSISFVGKKTMNPWYLAQKYSFANILIDLGDGIKSSNILVNISNVTRDEYTYAIRFAYNGEVIEEDNISKISLCIMNENNQYVTYSTSNVVFEKNDLVDFYVLVFKDNLSERDGFYHYDISIFHNMKYVHTIENCLDFTKPYHVDGWNVNDYPLDFRCIHFDRTFISKKKQIKERYLLIDGTEERKETDSEMSLAEWNAKMNNHCNSVCDVLSAYSVQNPLKADEISWNSDDVVKWKCRLGHEWKKKVKYVTTSQDETNICPSCREFFPALKPTILSREAEYIVNVITFIKEQLNIKNDIDFKDVVGKEYDFVYKKIEEVGEEAYNTWLVDNSSVTHIRTRFRYPCGKEGDVKMFAYKKYGTVMQINEFIYEATIPLENKNEFVKTLYLPLLLFPRANKETNEEQFLFDENLLFRYVALKIAKGIVNGHIDSRVETELSEPLSVFRNHLYEECIRSGQTTYRWVSEMELYQLVKEVYDDAIYQYKAHWLGLQSLDIFIPSRNIGIEYQGEQHYEPVEIFGGEEGLSKRQELDEKKRKLCKRKGITLIEWKYTIPITMENVKKRIIDKNRD